MRAPKLPIEVCERVIDSLAVSVQSPTFRDYNGALRSKATLYACALVCRDWTTRSQYHLFRQVQVGTSDQAHALLDVLICHPHTAKLVQFLLILPRPPPSSSLPPSELLFPPPKPSDSLAPTPIFVPFIPFHSQVPPASEFDIPSRDPAKETPIPPCYYNWIYKLLTQLPPLLGNLSTLALHSLPNLHPRFIRLVSRFKTVKALALQDLSGQSSSEIIQLINGLPQLTFLHVAAMDWTGPARFFASRRLRLEEFTCVLFDEDIRTDMLNWLGSLQHLSGLRSLQIYNLESSDMGKLSYILQRCVDSLRFLYLVAPHADILESLSLSNHSRLEYLRICIPSPPFPNHVTLFSSRISRLLSPSLVCLSIGYFENLDPGSFAASQSRWQDIDDALDDPKFIRLTYFVMELPPKDDGPLDHKTLRTTLKKIFPKSYQRGILWVVKLVRSSGWRAYHICEDDERDYNIGLFSNPAFRV